MGISVHSYTKEWFLFGKVRQKGQLSCIIPKHDTQNNIIGWEEEFIGDGKELVEVNRLELIINFWKIGSNREQVISKTET